MDRPWVLVSLFFKFGLIRCSVDPCFPDLKLDQIPSSPFKNNDQIGGPWIHSSLFKNYDQIGGPWILAFPTKIQTDSAVLESLHMLSLTICIEYLAFLCEKPLDSWTPSGVLHFVSEIVYMNLDQKSSTNPRLDFNGSSSYKQNLSLHQNPRDLSQNISFLVHMNTNHFQVHLCVGL